MPIYNYQCVDCKHGFTEMRSISTSNDPIDCPSCGANGKFKILVAPTVHVQGGDRHDSYEYKVSKALSSAKEERREHESKFGKYKEYVGDGSISERSVVDPDEVTHIGNVTGKDADDSFTN